MTVETAAWVGRTLDHGRYLVQGLLGKGGMALVYRAHDQRLDCDVVLKVPRQAMLEDEEFARRFLREVGSLVRLSHPHIVKVTDVGKQDDVPFAVLQYLSGGSLRDRRPIGPDGKTLPVAPEELRAWLQDVAGALDFIHGQGYIHRDIKPDNILFDAHGHAYLGDFGIAKVLAQEPGRQGRTMLTQTGVVLGTPQYMAPELLLGDPYDGRVDQYALAVTVYELLSGRYPFDGPTSHAIFMQQMNQEPPPLGSRGVAVAEAVEQALHQALAKEPGRRFADCSVFADAVLTGVASASVGGEVAPSLSSSREAVASVPAEPANRVRCRACGRPLKIPPGGQGKRLRCPSCGQELRAVPDAPRAPSGRGAAAGNTGRPTRAGVETAVPPNTLGDREPDRPRSTRAQEAAGSVFVSKAQEVLAVPGAQTTIPSSPSRSAPPPIPSSLPSRFLLGLSGPQRVGLIAAGIVAGVACLFALAVLLVTWKPAGTNGQDQYGPEAGRARQERAASRPKRGKPGENDAPPANPVHEPPVQWTDAREAVVQGDFLIRVDRVWPVSNRRLRIRLQIENAGKSNLRYTPWQAAAGDNHPRLTDNRERSCSWIPPGRALVPLGIQPAQHVSADLDFDLPPDGHDLDSLRLELPASAFGGADPLRFQLGGDLLVFVTARFRKDHAVPALRQALTDKDPEFRAAAARALGQIGPEAADAVGELTELLKDIEPTVRAAAAAALGGIGMPAHAARPALLQALRDADPQVSDEAVNALRALDPPTKDDLWGLQAALRDEKLAVRRYAVQALGKLGPEAGAALPELSAALKDRDPAIRAAAVAALGTMKDEAALVVRKLARALEDSEATVRLEAARALAGLCPAPGTIPALLAALKNPDDTVAALAEDRLKTAPFGKEDILDLADLLKHSSPGCRVRAASILARLGPAARSAKKTLMGALQDTDKRVRQKAARALGGMKGEAWDASRGLAKLLTDTDRGVRQDAVNALGEIGPDAQAAVVPDLIRALEDNSIHDQARAALVLVGKKAVEDLIELLSPRASLARIEDACSILGEIGPEASAAVQPLSDLAEGNYIAARRPAKEALRKIRR